MAASLAWCIPPAGSMVHGIAVPAWGTECASLGQALGCPSLVGGKREEALTEGRRRALVLADCRNTGGGRLSDKTKVYAIARDPMDPRRLVTGSNHGALPLTVDWTAGEAAGAVGLWQAGRMQEELLDAANDAGTSAGAGTGSGDAGHSEVAADGAAHTSGS